MHVNAKQKPSWKRFLSAIPEYACIAVMVVVVIVASILAPRFFSTLNLMNILKQSSVMCILAIGMGFVLISGCMDLSVGRQHGGLRAGGDGLPEICRHAGRDRAWRCSRACSSV